LEKTFYTNSRSSGPGMRRENVLVLVDGDAGNARGGAFPGRSAQSR